MTIKKISINKAGTKAIIRRWKNGSDLTPQTAVSGKQYTLTDKQAQRLFDAVSPMTVYVNGMWESTDYYSDDLRADLGKGFQNRS